MPDGVVLHSSEFGVLLDNAGQNISVQKFTWITQAGLKLSVLNLDAAIIELCAPDRNARLSENILLGVDSLHEYLQLDPAIACAARFEPPLSRVAKQHSQDEPIPVDQARVWLPFVYGTRLQLSLEQCRNNKSRLIIATITITVEPSNVVRIQYRTTCASGGLYRLAHRFLVNLAGRNAGPGGTYDHVVQLNSDSYVDRNCFLRSASENLADMRIAQHLGLLLYNARQCGNMEAALGGIYAMNNASHEGFAIRLIHTDSGRAMELYCDYPWMHFSTLSELPPGQDELVPFYPRQGLHRLSLVFDINRFVLNIVDALEKGSSKDPKDQSEDNLLLNGDQNPKLQGHFMRNAGLLIHPLGCPFKIKRAPRVSPSLAFIGHTTLKFGFCKELSKSQPPAIREINCIESE
uniref:Uncharacterized protein n=1 Tax=Anopheles atroparvus TaxID=41427 RepID=A0A182JLA6_ANOAO